MSGVNASEDKKRIGTHDGVFHADEVLGCFLIKQLPDFKNAVIIRSRDKKVLEKCDIVIDVGGEYDHAKKRYDHHQRGFNATLGTITSFSEQIKLSSAGLIWAHYGKDIVIGMTEKNLNSDEIEDVYLQVYWSIIREIDAKDNGIEAGNPPYRYTIHTDLSSRISRRNHESGLEKDAQFMMACDYAGREFKEIMEYTLKVWLPGKEVTAEALDNRFSVDSSGRIIRITTSGVNWKDHLKRLEERRKVTPVILFVVFPDSNSGWRVQAVSAAGGFILRKQVLPQCLALRDAELVAACGVEDAIFVHANGFIGGAKTYEGALKMAQMSIPD